MDHLWTPWRATYIESHKEPGVCVFCLAAAQPEQDREHLVVHRADHCFVILNRYPYTSGHLMIVPYQHVSKLVLTTPAASAQMMDLARAAEEILDSVYQPDGLNLGLNAGAAAGAGIAQHLHLHMLPRWSGDANFMTSIGNTRIIPESLDRTFEKLHHGFLEHFGK